MLALLALASAPAGADEAMPTRAGDPGVPLDRFSLSVGAFHARSDTTVLARGQLEGQSLAGRFNLERDLGLDQVEPVTRLRLEWLPGGRQGLALDVYGYRRANARTLARDIEYDGRLWSASATVEAALDYRFASAAWRHWWTGPDAAFGLGLGLAHYRVDSHLAGEATVEGETVYAQSRDQAAALAPLLSLGWRQSLGPHWRLYADASGVGKAGGDLSGHVMEAALGVEYRLGRRLSLAAEYGGTQIRLDRRRGDLDARLDLKLHGPSLFLRLH